MRSFWHVSIGLCSLIAAVAPAAADNASEDPIVPGEAAVRSAAPCAPMRPDGNGFHVKDGAIMGPNGPYIARGVNIYAYSMTATNNGAAIKATFKGLNFLRYITRPLRPPATYDPFVNYLTSLGVVV